jgi:hypothetical protein
VKEAITEIKKVAAKEPILGACGAIIFIERISSALDHVDGSSGSMGSAVNHSLKEMVKIIAAAPAETNIRNEWLNRLWAAVHADRIGYLDSLPQYWGELCASPELAQSWADKFSWTVKSLWLSEKKGGSYCPETIASMSSFLKAEKYQEILELIELAPYIWWHYRKWGVQALLKLGKTDEALKYAEDSREPNDPENEINQVCETILISQGRSQEAYEKYALHAHQKSTYLATFNEICKIYPMKPSSEILNDLIATTPGMEGKWFATARRAGFHDMALKLANHNSCEPVTLIRASRDELKTNPLFACEAGMAALRLMISGFGYEITNLNVIDALNYTLQAAELISQKNEVLKRMKIMTQSFTGKRNSVIEMVENFVRLNERRLS